MWCLYIGNVYVNGKHTYTTVAYEMASSKLWDTGPNGLIKPSTGLYWACNHNGYLLCWVCLVKSMSLVTMSHRCGVISPTGEFQAARLVQCDPLVQVFCEHQQDAFWVRIRPRMKTRTTDSFHIHEGELVYVSKSCSGRNDHTAVWLLVIFDGGLWCLILSIAYQHRKKKKKFPRI